MSLHHFSSRSMFQLVPCLEAHWFSLMTTKIIFRRKVFIKLCIPPCQQFHDTIKVIQVDLFLNFYFLLLYQFSDLVVLPTDNTYCHLASACSFQLGQENWNTCLHCRFEIYRFQYWWCYVPFFFLISMTRHRFPLLLLLLPFWPWKYFLMFMKWILL